MCNRIVSDVTTALDAVYNQDLYFFFSFVHGCLEIANRFKKNEIRRRIYHLVFSDLGKLAAVAAASATTNETNKLMQ